MGQFRALFPRGLRADCRFRARSALASRQPRGQAARKMTDTDQTGHTGAKAPLVDAVTVRRMLDDPDELPIIDVREELIFSQNHLLYARSVPLSRLELLFAALVPRRGTRIVLCDDDDGAAQRAAGILADAGYHNLAVLAGGVAGWQKAGFELFSGDRKSV